MIAIIYMKHNIIVLRNKNEFKHLRHYKVCYHEYKSTAVQIPCYYMYRYGTEKINNEVSHRNRVLYQK
jgi:hypothetical protein